MNYNKWSMICTARYMDLTPSVNIDELQQVEYDMYCTIHGSYSTCYHWWNTASGVWDVLYNTWILLHLLTLKKYNKGSMMCTVQYMDLTPPVDIDELHQVEYDMYCIIPGSYSTCWHWWITSSGVWYVLYNTWILLHLLTLMNYIKWSMICTVQYMDFTPRDNIDELHHVEYDMYCTIHGSYSTC